MNFTPYPARFPNIPPQRVEVAAWEVWMRHHKKQRPGLAEVKARLEDRGWLLDGKLEEAADMSHGDGLGA